MVSTYCAKLLAPSNCLSCGNTGPCHETAKTTPAVDRYSRTTVPEDRVRVWTVAPGSVTGAVAFAPDIADEADGAAEAVAASATRSASTEAAFPPSVAEALSGSHSRVMHPMLDHRLDLLNISRFLG